MADLKRTAHSECMFPSSGSGRGTKNLRKVSLTSKRKLGRIWDLIVSVPDHCLSFYFTWTLGIGHREVIIYPIDSNGDRHGLLTVYCASHNECGTSQYALNT